MCIVFLRHNDTAHVTRLQFSTMITFTCSGKPKKFMSLALWQRLLHLLFIIVFFLFIFGGTAWLVGF